MTNFNDKLIVIDDQNQLIAFLQQPTVAIAEGLTGILTDPGHIRLAAGKVVQAALKGKLFEQLGRELRELRASGRIKEDYFATHNQQATLQDLLKFIDENPPDEEVFKALKSIFFCAIEHNAVLADEPKAYQYLQVCKRLDSGAILILKTSWQHQQASATYLEDKLPPNQHDMNSSLWAGHIASKVHLPRELIELHAKKLLELNLFSKSGGHHVVMKDNRLTSFGLELCDYISRY